MAMKFTLLCLISMLFSCTKTTIETFTVVPKESLNYNIYIDSIRIETPGTTREFPYPFPSLNYSSDQFAGLDLRMGHINIFDKYTLDLKDSIVIYQEGPNI